MKKRIIVVLFVLIILSNVTYINAETQSDSVFVYVSTTLNNTKSASFSAVTYEDKNSISVTSVKLYKKNSNNVWEFIQELPLPTNATTTTRTYSATQNYSGYIDSGTYRIYTTFCADNHDLSRYSNIKTY